MLNLFRLYQGGGMGGSTVLPTDAMEQPLVMIEAFALMADFDARQREKDAPILTEDDITDEQAEANAVAERLRAQLMGG